MVHFQLTKHDNLHIINLKVNNLEVNCLGDGYA